MRSQFRLGRKLIRLLVFSMLAIAALFLVGSYSVHCRDFDNLYKSDVSKVATTAASLSDGAFLRELHLAVSTEEYQRIREQGDENQIVQWLKDQNLYDGYEAETELLRSIQQDMDVLYVYVQVLKGEVSTNLISPSDSITYLGYDEENPPEFVGYTENVHIEPTVTHTSAGWLSSAVEPIFDPEGNAVAVMCVDIDMNRVMRNRIEFLTAMVILGALAILASSLIFVRLIRRMVIRPLSQITEGAKKYGEARDEAQLRESVINFDIRSHDEMEDLYQEIRQMQTRIIDYMDTITREASERERISAELSVAAQIQGSMLPNAFPAFPGREEFDLYATVTPAKAVGGDFYDFYFLDENRLALLIADVAGKGIPGAMYMMRSKSLIKNRALQGGSPAEIISDVNEALCEGNDAEMFVTVWFAILDVSTGKGMAVNAGHEHPALRRKDGIFEMVKYRHSPAVATMEGIRFREHEFQLNPGDCLFVYTDGVAEATDAAPELFGEARMLEALNRTPDAVPKELLAAVKRSIDDFVGDAEQFDDITMLSLAFFGSHESASKTKPDGSAGQA